MSGPLNSNDIEDFVSSVRRLVSVDERPRPVSRDLAQDRLVLGPAFRVVPDVQDPGDTLILTVPVKDVEVAAAVPEAGPGPGTAPVSHTFEADWEEELWSEPEPPLSELALGAEEAEVIAETWPGSLDEVSAPVETPQADDAPWAEVGEDWLETDQVSATPEEPEEPEEPAAPEAATTAEEATARPDVLKLSAEDMLTDGEGNPLTVLDEAALQQIIRQLIREELKGVLGERITQSVRKLVRAEINRALAAHALD